MSWNGRAREMSLDALRPLFPVSAVVDYWSQNGQTSRVEAERPLGWSPPHTDKCARSRASRTDDSLT